MLPLPRTRIVLQGVALSRHLRALVIVGVLVTLKMVNMQAGGGSGEPDSEGGAKDSPVNAAPPVRGLCMSTTWLQSGGTALQMERFYDGGGVLRDVRLTRAVKGGWVGGSM